MLNFQHIFTFNVKKCIIFSVKLMEKYITNSENETENLAYEIAKKLNKDSVICLTGDLGTGKTRFVRGIAKYFGIENEVSSPTFTIVNEYTPRVNNESIKKIFHFDVYRLSDSEDFESTIGTDYFNSGLCIFEWGEIIRDIFPKNTLYITLRNINEDNKREIMIEGEI